MQKTALVTGATGAIGKAIARQLADKNFQVILAVRNESKAQQSMHEIISDTGNEAVHYGIVDLSNKQSVFDLAQRWQGPLHVLINNAATTPHNRQQTKAGIEMQFAVNVLGYFWMTMAFREHLKQSAPARIVNVASYWAGDLQMDDLEFKKRRYNNNTAYRQSKQANRMLSVAFAERLRQDKITVNACHPGDVNSKLSNDLGFGGYTSPDEGAETPVWLAADDSVASVSGRYFEHQREITCRFAGDHSSIEKLYQICAGY